jgi:hypothetical protein
MKMKNFINLLLVIPMLLTLLSSCGGDDNKVNNGGNNGIVTPFSDGNHSAAYGRAMALGCNTGSRLPTKYYHTTEMGYNAYNIAYSGVLQTGQIGGEAVGLFLGVSQNNDIIAVSKIANGSTVSGYNIAVSFCPYSYGATPIISTSRAIERVDAPYGINIVSNTTCAYNFVATSLLRMYIGPYSNSNWGTLPGFMYTMRFDPLYCN